MIRKNGVIRKNSGRFAVVLALVLSGLLLGAGPALAHDQLLKTNPADGSSVKALPDQIKLTFNETVLALGSVVKVVSPDGDVTEGKPKVVDAVVTQAVATGAPAGQYKVQWRVTSSDGHPISGEFSFTAKAGNTPEETAGPTETAGATETAEPTEGTETAEPTEGTETVVPLTSDTDDGGTSPVLIITLIVLAILVIGAAAYVLVIAPKRSGDN